MEWACTCRAVKNSALHGRLLQIGPCDGPCAEWRLTVLRFETISSAALATTMASLVAENRWETDAFYTTSK